MHSALWIVPILPFVLGLFTTWSIREAFQETVWFNVAYVASLALIYGLEVAGLSPFSTSPTGSGGVIALAIAFVALGIQRYRWKQERRRIAEAKAAERARRAAAGQPAQRSLIEDAFKYAASVQRARKNAKR
jgi:hypothetical protein